MLKVINRIADMGLTIRQVFDKFDRDNSRTCKYCIIYVCSGPRKNNDMPDKVPRHPIYKRRGVPNVLTHRQGQFDSLTCAK